mmetsp:Transcript_1244/g.3317  ORF Transcript_1244/g.3317 Transcript_1244/m.3317 type:complete len:200 (+) Transcript_1244:678-1277(+)
MTPPRSSAPLRAACAAPRRTRRTSTVPTWTATSWLWCAPSAWSATKAAAASSAAPTLRAFCGLPRISVITRNGPLMPMRRGRLKPAWRLDAGTAAARAGCAAESVNAKPLRPKRLEKRDLSSSLSSPLPASVVQGPWTRRSPLTHAVLRDPTDPFSGSWGVEEAAPEHVSLHILLALGARCLTPAPLLPASCVQAVETP